MREFKRMLAIVLCLMMLASAAFAEQTDAVETARSLRFSNFDFSVNDASQINLSGLALEGVAATAQDVFSLVLRALSGDKTALELALSYEKASCLRARRA